MSGPAISVIIPVYNVERFLDECLNSILAQDDGRVEIIAIDDGSSDSSAAMLAAFAARHPCLRVYRQNNRGAAAARNRGLAEARGDYVWCVDADDMIAPDALRTLYAALKNAGDILVFNGERFPGAQDARFYAQPKPGGVLTGQEWLASLCKQREFHHLVYLHVYRRAFLTQHRMRFQEGILHEDIGWVTETYLHAASVVYLDRVLYRYRRNPASVTGSREDASLMRRIDSYFAIVAQLREINSRCPMPPEALRLLRAEVVAQGIQVDRLVARLESTALRMQVRARSRRERFWQHLWPDATTWKTRRQLAKIMLRQAFVWR
jgi:glycosyltransferase involved in cell wall biosynthesis